MIAMFEMVFKKSAPGAKGSKYGVFSGPYFPTFGLNTERYSVSLRIQSKCGKIRARKTLYLDTFQTVLVNINKEVLSS